MTSKETKSVIDGIRAETADFPKMTLNQINVAQGGVENAAHFFTLPPESKNPSRRGIDGLRP